MGKLRLATRVRLADDSLRICAQDGIQYRARKDLDQSNLKASAWNNGYSEPCAEYWKMFEPATLRTRVGEVPV